MNEYSYSPPESTDDVTSSSSETYPYDFNQDDDGAPYVPPHKTTSVFRDTEPMVSRVDMAAHPVQFDDAGTSYDYKTSYGDYSFTKETPSSLILNDSSGERVATSWFTVGSDVDVNLGKAGVVRANHTHFVTTQPVYCDGSAVGDLCVSTAFSSRKEPKIWAWLNLTNPSDSKAFFIEWNVNSSNPAVMIDGQILDNLSMEDKTGGPPNPLFFEAGIKERNGQWNSRCRVDWRDAKCGQLTLEARSDSVASKVSFPYGMTSVDPTIVATSTSPFATSGPPFRNIVFYDGIYWLFYMDGTRILYTHSTDGGSTWSTSSALPTSILVTNSRNSFDIAIQGNHVAVSWAEPFLNGYLNCSFIEGYIMGSTISWKAPTTFGSIRGPGLNWIGGVALAVDGSSFVAYSLVTVAGSDYHIELVTMKKGPADTSFAEFGHQFPPRDLPDNENDPIPSVAVQPRFVSQPNGNVALVVVYDSTSATVHSTELLWNIYIPSLECWESSSPRSWQDATPIEEPKAFSVCPGKASEITVIYEKDEGDGLVHITLQGDSSVDNDLGVSGATPSVSTDQANELYIYFLRNVNGSNKVFEMHTGPGTASWSVANQAFQGATDSPSSVSAGERFSTRGFLSYTNQNGTPKQVMFGAIPLPADVVGPYGDPWSQAGISGDQPFDSGVSDVVSPGNGLLYVFQTDFMVPGRGIDMTASRFFGTPQYFVCNASGQYVPYLYDEFPYCDIGDGWQLNLPWIDEYYLHLWSGTKVALDWNGNTFNGTTNQPFTLTRNTAGTDRWYLLDLQDGMRVRFGADGRPSEIIANRMSYSTTTDVSMNYNDRNLSKVTDYLGRAINFTYYSDGKLMTLEFLGHCVNFTYSGGRLESTADPLGRSTSYDYYWTGNPSLLIQTLTLPTGGTYSYSYDAIQVGSEAIARIVSCKDEDPSQSGNDGHSTFYTYTAVDGVIKNTRVQECTGTPHRSLKGVTEYDFNPDAKNTVVTYFESRGSLNDLAPLKRSVSWYSTDGRVTRTETYDDFRANPDVASGYTDNKGNSIYSVDPLGHEVFSAYANTTTGNAFMRPGALSPTSSGKLFFDDFDDGVTDGWNGDGDISIDNWLGDNDLDPSLKMTRFNKTANETIRLTQDGSGVYEVVSDVVVMVKSTVDNVSLILTNEENEIVTGIRFSDPSVHGIQYYSGFDVWTPTAIEYHPDVAYRMTLHVWRIGASYQCNVFMNGSLITTYSPESVDPMVYFRVYLARTGLENCVVLDNVKLFRSWNIYITGLEAGQFVELHDSRGELVYREKREEGIQFYLSYDQSSDGIPYSYFVVRNTTGAVEFVDSVREIWGGDTYCFSEREYLECAISKTSSGFGSETGVIMDDQPPNFPRDETSNFIREFDPSFVLSGGRYHHDEPSAIELSHSYRALDHTLPTLYAPQVDGDDFLIQFVYLPSKSYPTTIGVRYYHQYTDYGDWECGWNGAYWGPNLLSNPYNTRKMGDLPLQPDQWLMLVVKASDIWWPWEPCDGAKWVRGMQFLHYGGDPYWDLSAYSSYEGFGKINVTGLTPGMMVELRRTDGSVITSATVQSGQNTAFLDVYGAGVNVFPLVARIAVYNSSGASAQLRYESPVFNDIYAHDEYSFSGSSSPFYVNKGIPAGFNNLLTGTMQFVDAGKSVSMESYFKYGGSQGQRTWLMYEQKAKNGSGWLITKYGYDYYGNVFIVTDPTGKSTLYHFYERQGTYLNTTRILVGSQNISTTFSYYNNGLLKSEADSRGNKTIYEYDKAGRVVRKMHPKVGGRVASERYEYDDVDLVEKYYDANGTITKTWYDGYGRPFSLERYDKSGNLYSKRDYYYAWNGKVKLVMSTRTNGAVLAYDYLGRVIKTWNADSSSTTTVYDDRNNTVITYDEMNARTDRIFDANDRLIQSVQYLGSTKLYSNMTYDGIGNLLTVTDPNGTMTSYEYDDMGRLVRIGYPYGGHDRFAYDNASRMIWKRTETSNVTYKYDGAGRLTESSSGQYDKATYTYDWNSNILTATRIAPGSTVLTITTRYDYDSWNRVLNEATTLENTDYKVSYTYDNRSNVLSTEVFKDATSKYKLKYGYDEFDRVVRVWDNVSGVLTLFASLSYNQFDQVTSIAYGNGLVTTYDLNPSRGWINGMTTSNGGTPLLSLTYTRDSVGRETSLSNYGRSFVYDTVGRLRYANDTGHTYYDTFEFTYDRVGNRLTQTWGAVPTTYKYDSCGRLVSNETGLSATTYQYIANTGLLWKRTANGETWEFSYDSNEMLIESKEGGTAKEKYWYDALGRRIKSITGTGNKAVTEYTMYSGSSPVYVDNRKDSIQTLHVYADGMHIAKKTNAKLNPRYYYHCDALGSVMLVTDKTKAVIFDADYLPFGKPGRVAGTESFMFLDSRGTGSSGLVHFGARYYDPNSGRFTTPDAVLGALSKPVTLNRYAYCLNDPINRMDKDGQWSLFKSLQKVVTAAGALIGNTIEVAIDVVVTVVEAGVNLVQKAMDVGERFLQDVKEACVDIADTVVAGCQAVQRAWDNLDPGLKQWIVNGVSLAVGFIPLVGPLLSCVIDGTFVDMFSAIMKGDWAMVGMCALAFVPGMKGVSKVLKFASHVDDVGKAVKKGDRLVVRLFGGKSGPLSKNPSGGGWMKAKDFVKSFAEGGPRHTFGIGGWNKGTKLEIGVLKSDRQVATTIARSADDLPGGGTEMLAKEGDFAFRGWLPFCWPPRLP